MNGSLWDLGEGEAVDVVGFDAQLPEAHLVRLTDLGFQIGASVTCVSAPRFGAPKLYRLDNTFYSLERIVAERVQTTAARS